MGEKSSIQIGPDQTNVRLDGESVVMEFEYDRKLLGLPLHVSLSVAMTPAQSRDLADKLQRTATEAEART